MMVNSQVRSGRIVLLNCCIKSACPQICNRECYLDCKRNHTTDHTRLTIRRVIGRWILSWPWNVGQRSLEVIESGTIWKFWYGFL